jgi:HK97 gp10 family phage protein
VADTLVHVKGLSELNDFLQQLAPKIERNVLRTGLRAGAKVVLPVAKGNIRSHSGELAASLKVGTRGRGGVVTGYVRTKVYYARFVEYGTVPHSITAKDRKGLSIGGLFFQSVQHPGAKPHPFLRPALDTQAQAAVIAAAEAMKERLSTKEGLDTSAVLIQGDE